ILSALIGLHLLGETINVMTLGGLALAVGILVDDATVMIENIDCHIEADKPLEQAIIDAANQILLPTFVATLAIAIVWIPLFHLSGIAGWVFPAMAEAVVFAMLTSFILTYTLVPTMAKYILKVHHATELGGGVLTRFQRGFQDSFDRFRDRYTAQLEQVIAHRGGFVTISMVIAAGSLVWLDF